MNDTTQRQWRDILILGAGELGMAVLEGFVKQREMHPEMRLSVLLRPASLQRQQASDLARRRQLADWNIAIVSADFSRQSTQQLAQCFAEYDAVINCSGFVGGPGTQLKITRAVLAAGVGRYIPWQFGVDYDRIGQGSGQPVWDEQLQVRELLRSQRQTRWVIVSTGMFTSYLFEPDFGVVDVPARRVLALGDADYALTLTTPQDIGTLTAAIFCHRPEYQNQVVYVAGDTLSYRQLAELLSRHYHQRFTLVVAERQTLRAAVDARPDDSAAAYRLAFARPDGVAWPLSTSYNARHGIALTDVKDWLVANAR
jgi:hypothetical protein